MAGGLLVETAYVVEAAVHDPLNGLRGGTEPQQMVLSLVQSLRP